MDTREPRNAPFSGVHGFFSRDGIPPEELLKIGREQLEPYPSVEVRSAQVSGTSGENSDDLEPILAFDLQKVRHLLEDLHHVRGLYRHRLCLRHHLP